MKRFNLMAILLISLAAVQAQKTTKLDLKGELVNSKAPVVYLQKFDNKIFHTIAIAKVVDGKFKFDKPVELPELYGIGVDTTRTPMYIFLEQKPISVTLDSSKGYNASVVTGSGLQDEFSAFKKLRNVEISDYIKAHPASLVTAYILYRNYAYRLTPEQIDENIALLDKSLENSRYVKGLHELTDIMNTVSVGKKAPDFSGTTPEGKTIKLSENYSKYTLIDFWASWCAPCRKENPNVVAAFKQFHEKGFNVFGVSLDKSKEGWIKAIASDHLDWLQVSELTYWASDVAKAYGVRAIPANFLIDDKGVIVGKNLRGEKLQEKLAELLGAENKVTKN